MSNETPSEREHWIDRLDGLDDLPGEPWTDRDAAWETLHDRLQNRPRRHAYPLYWVAAASIVLLIGIPLAILVFRQPKVSDKPSAGVAVGAADHSATGTAAGATSGRPADTGTVAATSGLMGGTAAAAATSGRTAGIAAAATSGLTVGTAAPGASASSGISSGNAADASVRDASGSTTRPAAGPADPRALLAGKAKDEDRNIAGSNAGDAPAGTAARIPGDTPVIASVPVVQRRLQVISINELANPAAEGLRPRGGGRSGSQRLLPFNLLKNSFYSETASESAKPADGLLQVTLHR